MKKKRARKPAVFLDRDGTLIHDMGFLSKPSQVRLFAGAAEALRLLRRAGFYLFVVSNQSGVARGYFPESSVRKANRKVQTLLKSKGARIDRFFYCPHFPQGKVKSLSRKCPCRKPEPGMVRQAAKRYPVDLKRSYVVGDKMDDLLLAQKARVAGGLLVRTGKGRKSEKELGRAGLRNAVVAKDVLSAARWIVENS
jgi:D-glycero-D-manno-heptose 1,7-bisphosphate phosphatase